MRNKIILIGAIAVVAYVVGARSSRVQVKNRESVGHQLVRLWDDPRARKRRHKAAKKAASAAEKRGKKLLRELHH
ncbi:MULTISPECIES: hypothetical protein [Microbacterium]|jgi:hypothetical protein|uniref:hypothetical protein n=1 Tax=Microbacterium TaxID=33882 RepID=UPI0011A3AEEF|nr:MULTISPECIES: hypothetical protein [Microbacterium]MCD2168914.1 hypothetical protein [Microbacterium sp. JC 701]MCM3501501.1 hypothetical protein [Microbacterium sp. P26]MDQ1172844.1 hypothetical protein [Microbacterium testaceum]